MTEYTCTHENFGHSCQDVRCDKCPHRLQLTPKRPKSTLYLDLDGVLANYDKRATEILGMDHFKYEFVYGAEQYWHKLSNDKDFWLGLELMPDAIDLLHAIGDRPFAILTALPRTKSDMVKANKKTWCALQLGEHIPVITCMTPEKPDFCGPGDILVDDRNLNRRKWEDKGGHFILHTSAENTIVNLRAIGAIA